MKQKNYNIPTVVYFVVTALLIAYFFPREGKFRYQFYEGKPWRYGLLTAPSDFPIYKTDDEVKAEKDSVLRKFEPYYRMNPDIQRSRNCVPTTITAITCEAKYPPLTCSI